MTRLSHQDVKKLLAEHREKESQDQQKRVAGMLDQVRKSSNRQYQSVVQGKRPSRKDRHNQDIANQMSRGNLKEYWLARMADE
jgi:hypothetical protein